MFTLRDLPKYKTLLELAALHPELDIASVETCLTFLRTTTDVYRVLDAHFARYDLSMGKFTILMLLYKAGHGLTPSDCLTPSECAEMAGVTRGTITGLLDGLEREGWIERQPHSADRRRLIVVLTDAGQQLLDKMLPNHFNLISSMMAQLTEAEKEVLKSLLVKLRAGAIATAETLKTD
ncbi:MAG: MarR family transcriptional regulator [Leptolyngbyaceae cyanobacterium MO_188.B28]|nr:MarR family transcriptional regulator [Leptolyngbyaceae cyanobacterium MO_188.B28]